MSQPKSKHGNRYSSEFKREAVLYYRSSSKSFKNIAKEMGVSDATLCTWNKEMKEQENLQPGSIDKTERDELIRLRREKGFHFQI